MEYPIATMFEFFGILFGLIAINMHQYSVGLIKDMKRCLEYIPENDFYGDVNEFHVFQVLHKNASKWVHIWFMISCISLIISFIRY